MVGSEEGQELGVRGLESGGKIVRSAGDWSGNAFSSSGAGLFMRTTHVMGGWCAEYGTCFKRVNPGGVVFMCSSGEKKSAGGLLILLLTSLVFG